MLDSELQRLKNAFRDRQNPSRWVRENLHPVDFEDATDFVREVESGHDKADLFQSAIPYFELLTNEARLFLLPDYLATLIPYPDQIIAVVVGLENQYGHELLASLSLAEHNAVMGFTDALSKWERMRPYADEFEQLATLLAAGRAKSSR